MQNNYDNQIVFGGFFARLAAYVIDSIIVWVTLLCIRIPLYFVFLHINGHILFHYTLKDIVLYLCGVSYFVLCTYYTGTTIGKRAMNLQVINANGGKLSLFNVIYRESIGRFLSGICMGLGYILVGIDQEKRGIQDILGDTRVVYRGRREKNVYQTKNPIQ
ncbi:RDD family protein [Faecalimonas sp.]